MNKKLAATCTVCGGGPQIELSGYLLVTRGDPSRLIILRWNRTLASNEETRTACSPEHALEMVAHWMVSGQLKLSFSQPAGQPRGCMHERPTAGTATFSADCQPISELVINRDSVRELVASDPEALASVLDSLLEALLRDRNPSLARKRAIGTAIPQRASIA